MSAIADTGMETRAAANILVGMDEDGLRSCPPPICPEKVPTTRAQWGADDDCTFLS